MLSKMGLWPENVGILAIEIIFPSQYVDQTELEAYDGVSSGKYTIGLGQSKMGFCSDQEDIHSLCLTVVQKLIEKYNINLEEIGHLQVGTETLIDKSKSVKTVLMQLFEPLGLTDIEGIDTTNACYGGTAALFNAISWVESSAWDGRKALVVAGDIAMYAKGPARPTGGAGAVAMLIGPNAPLVFDRGVRSSYMKHAYDFYKPDMLTEYPVVDGKLSIQCYLSALDNCYQLYRKKSKKLYANFDGLKQLDAIIFHSPFCKLVQKSMARIVLNDFLLCSPSKREKEFPGLDKFSKVILEESYFDKDVELAFMDYSKDIFNQKTKPSLMLANQVGNMYTSSVYGGLVSYLISKSPSELAGKRFGLFSYGSGLASSMYSITITNDFEKGSPLDRILTGLSDVTARLDGREKVDPVTYNEMMDVRAKAYHMIPYTPVSSAESLFPGTYYLENIDRAHRRTYARKSL